MQGAARGAAPRGDAAAAAGSKFPAGLGRVRLGLGRWGVVGSFLPLLAPSRSSRSRPSPMAASAQGEEEAVRGRFPAAAEGRCVGASGAGGEGLGKGGEKRLFLRAPGMRVFMRDQRAPRTRVFLRGRRAPGSLTCPRSVRATRPRVTAVTPGPARVTGVTPVRSPLPRCCCCPRPLRRLCSVAGKGK